MTHEAIGQLLVAAILAAGVIASCVLTSAIYQDAKRRNWVTKALLIILATLGIFLTEGPCWPLCVHYGAEWQRTFSSPGRQRQSSGRCCSLWPLPYRKRKGRWDSFYSADSRILRPAQHPMWFRRVAFISHGFTSTQRCVEVFYDSLHLFN